MRRRGAGIAGRVVNGWRGLRRTGPVTANARDQQWLLECARCGARVIRTTGTIRSASRSAGQMGRCTHPMVDEARRFSEDGIARFLVATHRELTLKAIGQAMGISHERARQIEEAALGKLRELPPEALEHLREAWQSLDDDRHEPVYPDTPDIGDIEAFRKAFLRMCRKHGYRADDRGARVRWAVMGG